jgi:hypothetical protein
MLEAKIPIDAVSVLNCKESNAVHIKGEGSYISSRKSRIVDIAGPWYGFDAGSVREVIEGKYEFRCAWGTN